MSFLSQEFVSVYMGLAKHVATMKNSCYSRKIGTIIVDPVANSVSSIGWNGPPRGCPDMDSKEHLTDYFWPKLTREEQEGLCKKFGIDTKNTHVCWSQKPLCEKISGCKTCPRRLIGANSGERTELCTCVHSELNAILNASKPLRGHALFCYADCGPCQTCATAMIQVGITQCYFVAGPKYHEGAVNLLERGGVTFNEVEEKEGFFTLIKDKE